MFIFYKNVHDDIQLVVTDDMCLFVTRLRFSLTKYFGACTAALAIFNFYMSMAKMSCSCGEDAISEKAAG